MLLRQFDEVVPIGHLSAGYQSVLALACDMTRVLSQKWDDVSLAEGIVLIDEIGAHLHPRWKMSVVAALRAAFPRVQVLSTTHQPLCLRGLEEGEVALLERGPEGGIRLDQDLPSVAALTPDQLLTSEHFGLDTTLSADLDGRLRHFYALSALRSRNAAQEQDYKTLLAELDELRVLGRNRRERRMLEAIAWHDQLEATAPDTAERRERRELSVRLLSELWSLPEPPS